MLTIEIEDGRAPPPSLIINVMSLKKAFKI